MGSWSYEEDYVSDEFPYPTPTSPLTPSFRRPSTQAPTNLLILGATGAIGTYITRSILEAKQHFGSVCVYTSEKTVIEKVEHVAALEASGVDIFMGELSEEKMFKSTLVDMKIDTIVSCLGRAVIEKQIPIITWAEECGVTRFFASEYGTDIEYFPESKLEPPHQKKLAVREHMKKCEKMEYTYLVTGPYSDFYFGTSTEQPEVGSFDVKKRQAWLLGDGDDLVSFTAMVDVGKFVVAALIDYTTSRNATLIVHSFTTTPNEILAEFESQTGVKWDVNYTSLEQLKSMEKRAYQYDWKNATAITLRRIWTAGGTLYKFYDDSLLGQFESQTLADQVGASIEKQTASMSDQLANLVRRLSAV